VIIHTLIWDGRADKEDHHMVILTLDGWKTIRSDCISPLMGWKTIRSNGTYLTLDGMEDDQIRWYLTFDGMEDDQIRWYLSHHGWDGRRSNQMVSHLGWYGRVADPVLNRDLFGMILIRSRLRKIFTGSGSGSYRFFVNVKLYKQGKNI